jgi:hypothetical protein
MHKTDDELYPDLKSTAFFFFFFFFKLLLSNHASQLGKLNLIFASIKGDQRCIRRHGEASFHQKASAHILSHSLYAIPKAVVQLKEIKLDAISKVLSNMFWLCKEKIALVKAHLRKLRL